MEPVALPEKPMLNWLNKVTAALLLPILSPALLSLFLLPLGFVLRHELGRVADHK